MENENYYQKIGLKVGLEVHQQLDVERKLFCNCPVTPQGGNAVLSFFERRLRPTRSELGEIDIAAYFEWKRGRKYIYQSSENTSCLVEADEEPPHPINIEAVRVGLAFAHSVGSTPVDELHVMRKIVIDGSNTTGFQRTALLSIGGSIELSNGKKIRISTICVEEDSSKKLGEEDNNVIYDLERLGVPLLEISTQPDINTPEEAVETALTIGLMLRLTGKAKRGIGSVRQDLNISVRGGTKVEVKGVQELELLPLVIENEARRQLKLLEIKELLLQRGLKKEDIALNIVDITDVLSKTDSKVVKKLLSKENAVALAICVPKMRGLLGMEIQPGKRFGTELSDYAKFWSGVKGIIHSDELPGYGLSINDVRAIYEKLKCSEEDAFIVIIDEERKARDGLRAVVERLKMAFDGVPPETRAAMPDGTTRFMRPLPGSARMYPETDIPPLVITSELLSSAKQLAPPTPKEAIQLLVSEYNLNEELAKELLFDENYALFMDIAKLLGKGSYLKTVAWMLVQLRKALKREGFQVENITKEQYVSLSQKIYEEKITKEGVEEVIKYLCNNPSLSVDEVMDKLGLKPLDMEAINAIIKKIIEENAKIVEEKGEKAFGIIMGKAMEMLRGRAQGKIVSELVRRNINEYLSAKKG